MISVTGFQKGKRLLFKGALSDLRDFLATESPLKLMKSAFYFASKAFPLSRYLSFCLDFFVLYQNGLVKKIRLISNFLTSQTGKQTFAIHILPIISRRKSNQTMKFGQLIECNMRYIFLEKSYTKCGGKTSSRLFSENLKLSKSVDQ